MAANSYGENPPQKSQGGSLLFWLVVHGVTMIMLLVVLLVLVPVCDKMIQEFGLKMPLVSVFVINLSRFLVRFGFLIIPLGAIFDGSMLSLLFLSRDLPRWFRPLWSFGILVAAGCLVLLVTVAIALPFIGLIQGVR